MSKLPIQVKVILAVLLLSVISLIVFSGYSVSRYRLSESKSDSLLLINVNLEKDIDLLNIQLTYLSKADSVEEVEFIKRIKKDSILIKKQIKELGRYKGLTNDNLLKAIDSAYEANH